MSEEPKKPEALTEEAKRREAAKARVRQITEEAKIAINAAATDKNVEIVLRYMMRLSGFLQKPIVIKEDGDVAVNATLFNSGREALYHDMRNLMSAETKNKVERSEA